MSSSSKPLRRYVARLAFCAIALAPVVGYVACAADDGLLSRPDLASSAASQGLPDPSFGVIYVDDRYHFALEHPQEWRPRPDNSPAFRASSPTGASASGFAENVSVVVEEIQRALPVPQFFKKREAVMESTLQKFELISDKRVRFAGRPAVRIEYRYHQGQPLHAVAYVLTKGKRGYIVTCTATEADFGEQFSEFQRILGSFRLTKT